MTYDHVLHHHVQRCLQRDLGVPQCEADDDGDYGAVVDGHIVWIRPLLDDAPALVRVWSPAVHGVKLTLALLKELNEINLGLRQVRCVLTGKSITVAAELELESIEPGELGRLVSHVGETALHVGELITTVFGGEMPFAFLAEDDADLPVEGSDGG